MADLQDTASTKEQNSEGVRQQLLAHLDATKDAINELNEEELESVAGGGLFGSSHATGGGSFDQTRTSDQLTNLTKSNSQSIGVGNSAVQF